MLETLAATQQDRMNLEFRQDGLGRLDQAWNQNWVRLAGIVKGDWAAGDLGNESHWVINTPAAIWIASEGELAGPVGQVCNLPPHPARFIGILLTGAQGWRK